MLWRLWFDLFFTEMQVTSHCCVRVIATSTQKPDPTTQTLPDLLSVMPMSLTRSHHDNYIALKTINTELKALFFPQLLTAAIKILVTTDNQKLLNICVLLEKYSILLLLAKKEKNPSIFFKFIKVGALCRICVDENHTTEQEVQKTENGRWELLHLFWKRTTVQQRPKQLTKLSRYSWKDSELWRFVKHSWEVYCWAWWACKYLIPTGALITVTCRGVAETKCWNIKRGKGIRQVYHEETLSANLTSQFSQISGCLFTR